MSKAKAHQNKQVVLVADDSSTVRKSVSFSLSSQNMEVITAVDGMDALEKVSQIPKLDLVIVDLNMPNMDGFEFIENSPDMYRGVPIIILSSERGEESKKPGEEVGANAHIEKPFDAKKIRYQGSKFVTVKDEKAA